MSRLYFTKLKEKNHLTNLSLYWKRTPPDLSVLLSKRSKICKIFHLRWTFEER